VRRCHKFDDFYAIASTFQECSLHWWRRRGKLSGLIRELITVSSIALAAKRH